MADGISIQVDVAPAITRLDALPGDVHAALLRKVSSLTLQLEAKVKGKLSGQVLNVRTGALRRSIFSKVDDQGLSGVYGTAASSGDVKYAAAHEFGFAGTENVRAHTRVVTSVFGRSLKEAIIVQVRPFARQMNVPERSFLRSSLLDMREQIVSGLTDAVRKALR